MDLNLGLGEVRGHRRGEVRRGEERRGEAGTGATRMARRLDPEPGGGVSARSGGRLLLLRLSRQHCLLVVGSHFRFDLPEIKSHHASL